MIKSANVNTEGNKAGISIKKTEAYQNPVKHLNWEFWENS